MLVCDLPSPRNVLVIRMWTDHHHHQCLPIACPSLNFILPSTSPWWACRLNSKCRTILCRSWLVRKVVESSTPTKKSWSSHTNSFMPPPYSSFTGLRMHSSSAVRINLKTANKDKADLVLIKYNIRSCCTSSTQVYLPRRINSPIAVAVAMAVGSAHFVSFVFYTL